MAVIKKKRTKKNYRKRRHLSVVSYDVLIVGVGEQQVTEKF